MKTPQITFTPTPVASAAGIHATSQHLNPVLIIGMGSRLHQKHGIRQLKEQGISCGPTLGLWEGIEEPGILVRVDTWDQHAAVLGLAFEQGEKCVLLVDSERAAFLLFPDSTYQYVGAWKPITWQQSLTAPAWTLAENLGQYYVASQC